MNQLILEKLKNEKIIGVIPINPKGLKIKFDHNSLTPSLWQILLMFLISLPITLPLLSLLSFILGDLVQCLSTVSLVLLIPIFLVILAMPTYLIYKIYVNKIKKYPETIFVITEQNFHFFLLKNNLVKVHHKFDVIFDKLSEVFFGEINKKTNVLGPNFEIRQNNKKIIKGKLKLANNCFIDNTIESSFLLPIKDLQNIYLQ